LLVDQYERQFENRFCDAASVLIGGSGMNHIHVQWVDTGNVTILTGNSNFFVANEINMLIDMGSKALPANSRPIALNTNKALELVQGPVFLLFMVPNR
jgi:hypothetical protein